VFVFYSFLKELLRRYSLTDLTGSMHLTNFAIIFFTLISHLLIAGQFLSIWLFFVSSTLLIFYGLLLWGSQVDTEET